MTITQASRCMCGCSAPVPPELAGERLCVFHFTLSIEDSCARIRREIATSKLTAERQMHVARGLEGYGHTLARVATGAQDLSDELKRRILSTFLTLMVMRESLRRSAESEVAKHSISASRA